MIFLMLVILIFSAIQVQAQSVMHEYTNLYNPLVNGSSCSSTTLSAAIADSSSNGKVIYLGGEDASKASCTWTFSSNVTVPNTRSLIILKPIVVNSGVTLTIQGAVTSFVGPNWYSGAGTVLVSSVNSTHDTRWVSVADYGTLETGNDDAPLIQAACDELASRENGVNTATESVLLFPSAVYKILSQVNCNIPDGTVIIAYGADLQGNTDVVWFDLNPDANPSNTSATVVAHTRWKGGWFTNSAATHVASTAIRMRAARNFVLEDVRIQGFFHGFEYSGKDTYRVLFSHFFNNVYSVINTDWDQTAENTIDTLLMGNSFTCNVSVGVGCQAGFAMFGKYINVSIIGGSFNGGSGGAGIAEVYFTNFPRGVSNNPRHITIEAVHFEGAADDNGSVNIHFDDLSGSGTGYTNVHITDNSFAGATSAVNAVILERMSSVIIDKNSFSQTLAGGGLPIYAPASSNSEIVIGGNNVFQDAIPLIYPPAIRCESRRGIYSISLTASTPNVNTPQEDIDLPLTQLSVRVPSTCPQIIGLTGTATLQTLYGGQSGDIVTLSLTNGGALGSSGNIQTLGPLVGTAAPNFVTLEFEGGVWREVFRSPKASSYLEITVADNGGGTAASGTIDTNANDVYVKCSDADGCNMTIGETSAYRGQKMIIYCRSDSTGECVLPDVTNVFDSGNPQTNVRLKPKESATLLYTDATSLSAKYILTSEAHPTLRATTFSALGTPVNGTVIYCSDCTIANPCAGSSTGAIAKRLNGVWVCN